jgi:hypothetical protein
MVMSATRIVGVPCACYPVVQRVLENGWAGIRKPREWFRNYGSAVALMAASILGAVIFFIYCQFRWGRWNIYMLTQSICWGIDPDYLAPFRPSTYRWIVPALNNPSEMSQMATTVGALLLAAVVVAELLPGIRGRAGWSVRLAVYCCAAIILYISISGVASVHLESMLRYEFCAHALIVLALVNLLCQFRAPPVFLRTIAAAAVVLISAIGLCLQSWWLWNFTRGNWVA